MKRAQLELLLRARAEKKPTVLVTDLTSGVQRLLIDGEASGDLEVDDRLSAEIDRAQTDADIGRVESLETEREQLLAEIRRATGLGGRFDFGFFF